MQSITVLSTRDLYSQLFREVRSGKVSTGGNRGCRDAIERASDRDSSDRWKLARKGKTRNRWNRDVVNPFTLRAGLSAPTLRIFPFLRSRLHAVGPRRDDPIVRRNPTESGCGVRRSSCRQVFSDREETSTFIPPRWDSVERKLSSSTNRFTLENGEKSCGKTREQGEGKSKCWRESHYLRGYFVRWTRLLGRTI